MSLVLDGLLSNEIRGLSRWHLAFAVMFLVPGVTYQVSFMLYRSWFRNPCFHISLLFISIAKGPKPHRTSRNLLNIHLLCISLWKHWWMLALFWIRGKYALLREALKQAFQKKCCLNWNFLVTVIRILSSGFWFSLWNKDLLTMSRNACTFC